MSLIKTNQVRMFRWIDGMSDACTYNLAKNDLHFPDPEKAGIDHQDEETFVNSKDIRREYIRAIGSLLGVDEIYIHPVSSGSTAIYISTLLMKTMTEKVMIPKPEYEPMYSAASLAGLEIEEFSMGDELHGKKIMMSLPNNPLGIRPDSFLNDVREGENILFADETFILFNRKKRTAFKPHSGIIVSGTTTKYFGLSPMKAGWIICDDEYSDDLINIIDTVSPGVPAHSMWAASMVMKHLKYFEERAKLIMERNLSMVHDFVSDHRKLSWIKPDSAPVGFINFGEKGSVDLCTRILKKTGVLLVPGEFMHDDSGFRISFILETEKLQEALDRIDPFFK